MPFTINDQKHDVYSKLLTHAPYTLSPYEIEAMASRLDTITDYFEKNPKARAKGKKWDADETQFCLIGAMERSRKIGLKFDPKASRNISTNQAARWMSLAGLTVANDSDMTHAQVMRLNRKTAQVLRQYAAMVDNTFGRASCRNIWEKLMRSTFRNELFSVGL